MTNTIDLSISILTSHYCTTPYYLAINLCCCAMKETWQCVLTHPYKAGSNTWTRYLDILEALFMRHEVANCGNQTKNCKQVFHKDGTFWWKKKRRKQQKIITWNEIRLGKHLNHIFSPLDMISTRLLYVSSQFCYQDVGDGK